MKSFKLNYISSCSLLLLVSYSSFAKNALDEKTASFDYHNIIAMSVRGELKQVLKIFEDINDGDLNQRNLEIKESFYDRFVNETEVYDFKTTDKNMIEFVKIFHVYWHSVMLEKMPIEAADLLFENTLAEFLIRHLPDKDVSTETVKENLSEYSNMFIKDNGFFSNASGKTGHMYDLFLWKNQEIQIYTIDLINDSVEVPVYFMNDFISAGWSHYATFGKSYASGWATNTALYSVADAYDRNSEKFKVSYLAHEGQHFADYINFPLLKQADLEYRAKLVELVQSEETTHQLISKFIYQSKNEIENAHAYANYSVMRGLSKLIYASDYLDDISQWENTNKALIRSQSLVLYAQHTAQLIQIGSLNVKELITDSDMAL